MYSQSLRRKKEIFISSSARMKKNQIEKKTAERLSACDGFQNFNGIQKILGGT